jgi:hypothetical protein
MMIRIADNLILPETTRKSSLLHSPAGIKFGPIFCHFDFSTNFTSRIEGLARWPHRSETTPHAGRLTLRTAHCGPQPAVQPLPTALAERISNKLHHQEIEGTQMTEKPVRDGWPIGRRLWCHDDSESESATCPYMERWASVVCARFPSMRFVLGGQSPLRLHAPNAKTRKTARFVKNTRCKWETVPLTRK